jgi:hypothetical protein
LINKADYDIIVVHGTSGASPVIPNATPGYWTIAEIFVPHNTIAITIGNIYDTTRPSQKVISGGSAPKNWTTDGEATLVIPPTRVLRLEFWSTLFGIDHDPTTGYHRPSGWHIGSTLILVTGDELNTALSGINKTYVTAANLTSLTDGTILPVGTLHTHGAGFETWDSGWFAVSVNHGYDFTHNLGALPRFVSIWFSESSDGSNARYVAFGFAVGAGPYAGTFPGVFIKNVTTTTCRIATGSTYIYNWWDADGFEYKQSGYCRVALLK